jgi:hypothetical protein
VAAAAPARIAGWVPVALPPRRTRGCPRCISTLGLRPRVASRAMGRATRIRFVRSASMPAVSSSESHPARFQIACCGYRTAARVSDSYGDDAGLFEPQGILGIRRRKAPGGMEHVADILNLSSGKADALKCSTRGWADLCGVHSSEGAPKNFTQTSGRSTDPSGQQ